MKFSALVEILSDIYYVDESSPDDASNSHCYSWQIVLKSIGSPMVTLWLNMKGDIGRRLLLKIFLFDAKWLITVIKEGNDLIRHFPRTNFDAAHTVLPWTISLFHHFNWMIRTWIKKWHSTKACLIPAVVIKKKFLSLNFTTENSHDEYSFIHRQKEWLKQSQLMNWVRKSFWNRPNSNLSLKSVILKSLFFWTIPQENFPFFDK